MSQGESGHDIAATLQRIRWLESELRAEMAVDKYEEKLIDLFPFGRTVTTYEPDEERRATAAQELRELATTHEASVVRETAARVLRVAGAVVGLLTVSPFAGCEGERQPGPPVPLKSFALHDVQGLFGGHALWAGENRAAFIQVVGPPPAGQTGLWEKRYSTQLTAEQWAEVERLVGAHHLLTLRMPERPGVPDEAHPSIEVVPQAGAAVKVRKLAYDKHPDFDPVYAHLLGLCHERGAPLRKDAFDWDWRPDGFEPP